jgi:hypothetical protein
MIVTLLLLAACQDQNFSQLTQEDVFQQERIQTVDVLLVVDNSCSMVEEQRKLAANFDSFIQFFDEAEVDWQIGVVTTDVEDAAQRGHLIGGDDEIVLSNAEGRSVDSVAYTRTWGIAPGMVLALDPSRFSTISNDSRSAWCSDVAASPGVANDGCTGAAGGPGADVRRGAVVITEFLADPSDVADEAGEWVEITNISDAEVSLAGWTLSDRGRNLWSFPADAVLPAGASRVVARTMDVSGATWASGADFTLNNADLYLTAQTEGASEIFSEIVAQGTTGSGLEQGLEAARLAITEPLLTGDNAGFIRPDANFSVLVVSDEEDSSPDPVSTYLRAFADLKGPDAYRDRSRMNVSAVVGDDAPEFEGEASCASENGVADYGRRYVAAVDATGGLHDSICAEDFSAIVNDLGLTLSGLQAEFELSRFPVLSSIEVSLYADGSNESLIRVLTPDVDYTYIEERNVIRFEYEQVPDSENYVLVEYKIRSGS